MSRSDSCTQTIALSTELEATCVQDCASHAVCTFPSTISSHRVAAAHSGQPRSAVHLQHAPRCRPILTIVRSRWSAPFTSSPSRPPQPRLPSTSLIFATTAQRWSVIATSAGYAELLQFARQSAEGRRVQQSGARPARARRRSRIGVWRLQPSAAPSRPAGRLLPLVVCPFPLCPPRPTAGTAHLPAHDGGSTTSASRFLPLPSPFLVGQLDGVLTFTSGGPRCSHLDLSQRPRLGTSTSSCWRTVIKPRSADGGRAVPELGNKSVWRRCAGRALGQVGPP